MSFHPNNVVIDTYVERLRDSYTAVYGRLEPDYPGILSFCGRIALENIATSDAAYHDVNHTIMVTEVGQVILKGRQLKEGGVGPRDWVHFVIALLCHDIGYVRGVCRGDTVGHYVIDSDGTTTRLPVGSTDAALTPHHVTRSKIFVRERFGSVPALDPDRIEANIEHTRFPVPAGDDHARTDDYPGLLRAADLIGQMADIDYLRKTAFLFHEFQETGAAQAMGYASPADLRAGYPRFFWNMVRPYLGPALEYLGVTQEGKQWINNLYANVFIQEHQDQMVGARPGGR
ncbi:metal-dependent phosphohydrolase [Roseospirillum parvum]|uniref:HD/PDEase domain-containing protein n=1 Tax=Roseospirillum parvum TaxID=83401 RepID=A0A1G7ZF48_9PROT|nr:metal-dependent phosphohydrolase [Roseospirillum parvum]SDH07304.1 hypothetical protein SAMN05421742_10491 [Roseospirillum parvum]